MTADSHPEQTDVQTDETTDNSVTRRSALRSIGAVVAGISLGVTTSSDTAEAHAVYDIDDDAIPGDILFGSTPHRLHWRRNGYRLTSDMRRRTPVRILISNGDRVVHEETRVLPKGRKKFTVWSAREGDVIRVVPR